MNLRCGLLLLLLLVSPVFGEKPVISLPEKLQGTRGAFIEVPSTTEGKEVVWVSLSPELNLFPIRLLKDSKTMVVSSLVDGNYRLMAYTALGDEPSLPAFVTITVGAPVPVPPGPGPDPGPTPPGPTPVPEGAWGLTKFAYELTLRVPATSRGNALAIATNARAIASAAAAGTINDIDTMFVQLANKNNQSLGNDLPNWKDFFAATEKKFTELDGTNSVTTVTNAVNAFNAYAAGMELAARSSTAKGR